MNTTAPAPQATRRTARKCDSCSKRAVFVIRNAFASAANGKAVCGSSVCFGSLTGGYPAEGKLIG